MAVEPAEIHRLTADEYHLLIESGGFDEDARVELIDGLLLDMSPKTPAHEDVIAWLARRLFAELDLDRYEIARRSAAVARRFRARAGSDRRRARARSSRTIRRTAALVVEVALSSQRRDLRVKPRSTRRAGVPVYWVIDVDGGRAVAHTDPVDGGYGQRQIVAELVARRTSGSRRSLSLTPRRRGLTARSPRRRRSGRRRTACPCRARRGRARWPSGAARSPSAVGFGPSTPEAMISAAVAETCGAAMLVPT